MKISIATTLYKFSLYIGEFHRRIDDIENLADDYEIILVEAVHGK